MKKSNNWFNLKVGHGSALSIGELLLLLLEFGNVLARLSKANLLEGKELLHEQALHGLQLSESIGVIALLTKGASGGNLLDDLGAAGLGVAGQLLDVVALGVEQVVLVFAGPVTGVHDLIM